MNRKRIAAAILLMISSLALANHGPGAAGGGSSTISGETLPSGKWSFELREDFTKFEHFSSSRILANAAQTGDFDTLGHSFITTGSASYGITDDFQLSASVGYVNGHGFIGAGDEDGDIEVGKVNPQGMTDLSILGKYRFMTGQPGNISALLGVTLPTGRTDVSLDNGERLSPTDQPGSGRFGLPVGLSYSRYLTPHLTIDASALYTFHFEKDDFKIGDRLDAGVALAYRITESIKDFPQATVFVELNDVYLQKDEISGEKDGNSGSNTLYVTPGVRLRWSENASMTFAPSFPVAQDVNGVQGKVEYKIGLSLNVSF